MRQPPQTGMFFHREALIQIPVLVKNSTCTLKIGADTTTPIPVGDVCKLHFFLNMCFVLQ